MVTGCAATVGTTSSAAVGAAGGTAGGVAAARTPNFLAWSECTHSRTEAFHCCDGEGIFLISDLGCMPNSFALRLASSERGQRWLAFSHCSGLVLTPIDYSGAGKCSSATNSRIGNQEKGQNPLPNWTHSRKPVLKRNVVVGDALIEILGRLRRSEEHTSELQ